MNQFDYYEPKTIEEACSLLSQFRQDACILAGGTDLIPKMKRGLKTTKCVVNIKKVLGLDYVREERGEGLRIGALTLLSELAVNPLILDKTPILISAANSIGSPQVRNLATLGGNLSNAAPSADMAPGLLALDSIVKISGLSGQREIPIEEFFLGPGVVNLGMGEILTEIYVPYPSTNNKQIYLKHNVRRAMDIAVVGVAVCLSFEEKTCICKKARIAFGAVAPTPIRAKKSENVILGKKPEDIPLFSIGELVRAEVAPISDVRGSASYRYEMVSTLTIRAIKSLCTKGASDEKSYYIQNQ